MKRSGPPERRKPLGRGKPLQQRAPSPPPGGRLRRTPLASRSKARTAQQRDVRVPLIQALLDAGRSCEVCPQLAAAGFRTHCAGTIEGTHERRKSGAGGSRINLANLVPACNYGNGWIEDNPDLARALGTALVVREEDPEWESLGRRMDRAGHQV